jgi:hypothetical protein
MVHLKIKIKKIYISTCCSILMENLVSCLKGGTWIEGVWEQNANFFSEQRKDNSSIEKITEWNDSYNLYSSPDISVKWVRHVAWWEILQKTLARDLGIGRIKILKCIWKKLDWSSSGEIFSRYGVLSSIKPISITG